MPINKQSYKIIGMRQDNLVNTGTSDKYAHEIKNMRLNTVGDYTTGVWTNERGTKEVEVVRKNNYIWITDLTYIHIGEGTKHYKVSDFNPIGQANIKDTWILFGVVKDKGNIDTNAKIDVILSLEYIADVLYGRILYWSKFSTKGRLNFDASYPIETLSFYENEDIQKVYWTDGLNQPRVINIKGAEFIQNAVWDNSKGFNPAYPTQFDFVQEVSLNETVEITKDTSGAGLFPPCTVKYVITYYHKYGQESNIVYDSPLYYPIIGNRDCSEDELSGDSFYIKIKNVDLEHGFNYIRLYSIIRTTENATPIVRIVGDKEINNNTTEVLFIDTNTTGEIVDPTILNYIGGREIIAQTFDQKDNTLFLGNIELKTKSVKKILEDTPLETNSLVFTNPLIEVPLNNKRYKTISIRPKWNDGSFYQYANQLTPIHPDEQGHIHDWEYDNGNSQAIKIFKYQEWYRFGIQFQDNKGVWSEVVPLKDLQQTNRPLINSWNSRAAFSIVEYTLTSSIKNKLYNNDYRKARLVCCYPNNTDRSIVAQGVLCPTVYNVKERGDNDNNQGAPYAMSSWFFRPNENIFTPIRNSVLQWQHDGLLSYMNKNNSDFGDAGDYISKGEGYSNYEGVEIQSMCPINDRDNSAYKVDRTIWTFNSPEIDFDESIRTLPRDGFTINIIGAIPISSYTSTYYLEATSPNVDFIGYKGSGFKELPRIEILGDNSSGSHALNTGVWNDSEWYFRYLHKAADYPLYPFQRKGSLSNYMRDLNFKGYHNGEEEYDVTESSVLKSKVLAHLLYSNCNLISESIYSLPSVDTIDIFDSNEVLPVKLKVSNKDKIYYGNVNTIAPIETINLENISDETDTKKLFNVWCHDNAREKVNKYYGSYYLYSYGSNEEGVNPLQNRRRMAGVSSDPVPITYKSTPHAVFYCANDFIRGIRAGSSSGIDIRFSLENINSDDSIVPFVIDDGRRLPTQPYMYLAEIKRNTDENTRFGGDINTANNIYIPCGPAVKLNNDNNSLILKGYEGDYYFMRYDCLKTYPYATDDTNQIVEILSFMCETRINLDGRYDRNRGLTNNTMVSTTNFNLINKSYSQSNNFFSYTTLDDLSVSLDKFGNQFTWTKPKTIGEDIDTWTNITLASTADATGTLGDITKILNLNDNLYLFQEHGIAVIGFNEKTAISTEAGIPLELANTGKYTGLKYISSNIGCQNKWSISNTKNGVFFIDDSRQELLGLGEQLTSLSTINGFDAFMINNLPKQFTPWNPVNFDNFVTYYDKVSNDVYYINKNYCLAWNEQTKSFTSFYSYEATPYMTNLGTHSLMWNNGIWAAREYDAYNTFFDNVEDYWITLVCDGITSDGNAFPADKVFNNVEYRADIYNEAFNMSTASNFNDSIFNIKHIWNGYQDSNDCSLDGVRKFNTWRVQLPRHYGTRDRIRSPFCYINLKQNQHINSQTNRAILHDLAVYFDIK